MAELRNAGAGHGRRKLPDHDLVSGSLTPLWYNTHSRRRLAGRALYFARSDPPGSPNGRFD